MSSASLLLRALFRRATASGFGHLSWFLGTSIALLIASTVLADSGVSDERVSLPDGPGSTGGAGENLSAGGNMGAMTYQVPIYLPEGFADATPSLSLNYNSMNGNGLLGVGWEMSIPHIERFSVRGLPKYNTEDRFAADGSQELVRVGRNLDGSLVFRERFEGSFVQYSWHDVGGGTAGYWIAEYPDGTKGFFGANAAGDLRPRARVTHPDGGVFRYMLVETVDSFGHRVVYEYETAGLDQEDSLDDAHPRPSRIEWLFKERTEAARYRVEFSYEPRADVLSNGLPGFELRLDRRLSGVKLLSHGKQLARYALRYREAAAGLTRLSRVERHGTEPNDALFPGVLVFKYSSSLELDCGSCERPFLFSMGSLSSAEGVGVDLQSGRATLLDFNGDALPDILDTTDGKHHFFFNQMTAAGQQSFSAAQASRVTERNTSFRLEEARVQAADVNGDGFTDVFRAGAASQVLCNNGQGVDWVLNGVCKGQGLPGALSADQDEPGDANPEGVRFFDYDGDKRIDALRTASPGTASIWYNGGPDSPPQTIEIPSGLGRAFDQGNMQLADLNGDGLLDLVDISHGGLLWQRLYLGYGRWQAPRSQSLSGLLNYTGAELQDLNGDGLDDVVLVAGNAVHFALNRAGRFQAMQTLTPEQVKGGLPSSGPSVTVLFADMNASGTTDIVWVDSSDNSVQVLEMFAMRPNLLTRIDNGIGGVQVVEYGTSALQQARDKEQNNRWRHRLPQAINVVTASERFTTLAPTVVLREERKYHHGYYDGTEKRYRGFEQVEERAPGDATQEGRKRVLDYDVGKTDVYKNGLLTREEVYGGLGDTARELQSVLHRYSERCPLANLPETSPEVRFVCETAVETVLKEDLPESQWLTLRVSREYDGYGNMTKELNHGVVGTGKSGAGGCGPCDAPDATVSGACWRGEGDARCLGDEHVVETSYIQPGQDTGGSWNLHSAWRMRSYARSGGAFTETLIYYDGDKFRGMKQGELRAGLVTRLCQREAPEAASNCEGPGWVQSLRVEHDGHGNVVTSLDPMGSPGDFSGHRQSIDYGGVHGHRPTAVVSYLSVDGEEYKLRREIRYHKYFDAPEAISALTLQDAPLTSERRETQYSYDDFGRPSGQAAPGDSLEEPTHTFDYHLSDPVSRVVSRTRSQRGLELDLEEVSCLDGFGRTVQTRTRLEANRYQVTGFLERNLHGAPVRTYHPYQGDAGCHSAPADVAFTSYRYDALGRILQVTESDRTLYGDSPTTRHLYAPLKVTRYDAEDGDRQSHAYDTPVHTFYDGLGRPILFERSLESDGKPGTLRTLWDPLGHLAGSVDVAGHEKLQRHDLLGRLVAVSDPNTGESRYEYDAAGNLRRRTDAQGRVVEQLFDGDNRLIERFDPMAPDRTRVRMRYDFAEDCQQCTHGEGLMVQTRYPLGGERGWGQDAHGFDLRGRLESFSRTLATHTFRIRNRYDNAGRLVHRHFPDDSSLTYRYDVASRPHAIDGIVDALEHNEQGLLSRIRYANGVTSEFGYDALLRLDESSTHSGDTILQGFRYRRDRVGNLTSIADMKAFPERSGYSVTYLHDAWYRTTGVTYGDGEVLEMAFDPMGNITQKASSLGAGSAAHVGSYEYEGRRPNAVRQAGELSVSYDESGRARDRGGHRLEWDFRGRLAGASSAAGAIAEYGYDAQEVSVVEDHDGSLSYTISPDFEVRDGVAVSYARLGNRRFARLSNARMGTTVLGDPNGNSGVDVGDAWLSRSQGPTARQRLFGCARRMLVEAEGGRVYLHSDHLESLTLATALDGSIRGEALFYPTGEVRHTEGYVDRYGFTGQRRDATTGLLRYLFRELDTHTGRWMSADPLFEGLSLSSLQRPFEASARFSYVDNSFSSNIDPTGLVGESKGRDGVKPNGGGRAGRRNSDGSYHTASSKERDHSVGSEDSFHTARGWGSSDSSASSSGSSSSSSVGIVGSHFARFGSRTHVPKTIEIPTGGGTPGRSPARPSRRTSLDNALGSVVKEVDRAMQRGRGYLRVGVPRKHLADLRRRLAAKYHNKHVEFSERSLPTGHTARGYVTRQATHKAGGFNVTEHYWNRGMDKSLDSERFRAQVNVHVEPK